MSLRLTASDVCQFEKTFAIGLKERTDRHDYLALAASISGIRVEWLDGARGETILEKALPEVCIPDR